jgi:hypothetical protein
MSHLSLSTIIDGSLARSADRVLDFDQIGSAAGRDAWRLKSHPKSPAIGRRRANPAAPVPPRGENFDIRLLPTQTGFCVNSLL